MICTKLFETMSMTDYHLDQAYGASDIIKMSGSFAQWKFRKDQPKEKTRALVVGGAFHAALQAAVMGDRADEMVLVYNDGSSRTKGFEKFSSENPVKYCVDADEAEMIGRMVKAVLNEPEAMKYLTGAIAEPSFFAKDPEFGIRRKCRPDFLHVQKGVSINVKTTSDATEKGFFRSIADYAYDFQTCNYQDILRLHYDRSFDEIHILVEKSDAGPCRVAIRGIDDDCLDQARAQMRHVFAKIVECEKSGKWEDEKAELVISQVPQWARTVIGT